MRYTLNKSSIVNGRMKLQLYTINSTIEILSQILFRVHRDILRAVRVFVCWRSGLLKGILSGSFRQMPERGNS